MWFVPTCEILGCNLLLREYSNCKRNPLSLSISLSLSPLSLSFRIIKWPFYLVSGPNLLPQPVVWGFNACFLQFRFRNSRFLIDNGGFEGWFLQFGDWNFGRVVPEVFGLPKGSLSLPGRSNAENCCHAVQAHWRQPALSRDGAFFFFCFVYIQFSFAIGSSNRSLYGCRMVICIIVQFSLYNHSFVAERIWISSWGFVAPLFINIVFFLFWVCKVDLFRPCQRWHVCLYFLCFWFLNLQLPDGGQQYLVAWWMGGLVGKLLGILVK